MNKQQLLELLKAEGFSDDILNAFENVRREDFISEELKKYAYENEPLPIGEGATISQPYTIAFMLELLELDRIKLLTNNKNISSFQNKMRDNESKIWKSNLQEELGEQEQGDNKIKVLEIGSGSGYVLALINELFALQKIDADIYGVEINKELVQKSKLILREFKNIEIINSDGKIGLKEHSPFDRILVSAAFDEMPTWLFGQLNDNGILVVPVKNSIFQIKKINGEIFKKEFEGFVFVGMR